MNITFSSKNWMCMIMADKENAYIIGGYGSKVLMQGIHNNTSAVFLCIHLFS
jgi:hypothetical protein